MGRSRRGKLPKNIQLQMWQASVNACYKLFSKVCLTFGEREACSSKLTIKALPTVWQKYLTDSDNQSFSNQLPPCNKKQCTLISVRNSVHESWEGAKGRHFLWSKPGSTLANEPNVRYQTWLRVLTAVKFIENGIIFHYKAIIFHVLEQVEKKRTILPTLRSNGKWTELQAKRLEL